MKPGITTQDGTFIEKPFTDFGSMRVFEVEPGTEIRDPRTGQIETVTDGHAVVRMRDMYLTPKGFANLKKAALE
jgi:hypothetical protein